MRSRRWLVCLLTVAFGATLLAGAADVALRPAAGEQVMPVAGHQFPLVGQRELPKGADETPGDTFAPEAINDAGAMANYTFVASSGTFTPLTGGTLVTTLQADDAISAAIPIGFDFWFMGERYANVYVSTNGFLSFNSAATSTAGNALATSTTSVRPLVAPLWDDMDGRATGGSTPSYRTTGSAGSRVFTFEWLNWEWNYTAGVAVISMQAKLYEGSGKVEFVYRQEAGAYVPGTTSGASIGLAASATGSGNFLSLSDSSASPAVSSTTETSTIGVKPATGQVYAFTPPFPAAPTDLSFTAVTQTGMTLNWTDNATNEVGYAIYRSTDGVNYSFIAPRLAAGSTSYVATGLLPGTTYYWKVVAVTEGGVSASLDGTQATLPATEVTCVGAGGNWSAPATWSSGLAPSATDNITITDGCTVTIDTTATVNKLTVGQGVSGILQFEATTARTLTVNTDVTIAAGGTFQSAASGTTTTHLLSIATNLTNNGTLDFSTNANTAGAEIRFAGADNATFGGSGTVTDIRRLSLSKPSVATLVDVTIPFTANGAATSDTAGFLIASPYTGTLRISGTFTYASNVFLSAAYSIPTTGGFWLNNPNFTVNGMNGSPTMSGRLRVSAGTYNIGNSSGNSMGFASGSTVTIEGGAVNAAGRFGVSTSTSTASYTQSGGVVTVATVGNTSTTLASFDMGTASGASFTMSGGSIVVQTQNTATSGPRDYRAATGSFNVSGGTLRFGNAASGATARTFNAAASSTSVASVCPNLVIDNTSAGHSLFLQTGPLVGLTATVNTGTTLNLNGFTLNLVGTLTNNGTITGTTASSRLYFGGSAAQTWTGTGTVTTPLDGLSIDNTAGVTLAGNPFTTLRVNLFRGTLNNTGIVTLGNGGTTSAVVQIGSAGFTVPGGNFDVAPIFNIGSGGYQILYQQEGVGRTTGVEIPATRTVGAITINNTNGVTLAGGALTLTGTTGLTLTAGKLFTSATNLLVLGTTVTTFASGSATSYVQGPYALEVNSATDVTGRNFPVGTATGWRPVVLSAFNSGGTLQRYTAEAIDGNMGGTPVAPLVYLNTARYFRIQNTANIFSTTTATVQLSYGADDTVGTPATARVAQSATPAGAYASIGGATATSPTTGILSTAALTPGQEFFVIGNEALPPLPPPNDDCGNAVTIPAAGPFPYLTAAADVTQATTNGDPTFCASTSHTIWYTFTPSATATYTITSCQASAPGTTATDTVLGVFTAPGCGGPFTTTACNDNDSACAGGTSRSTVSPTLYAGTTYYINVGTFGTSTPSPGLIQLSISQTLPPANDTCAAPQTLALDTPVTGTTANAIDDYQLSGSTCFTSQGQIGNTASTAPGRDVVYSFTAPIDGSYSFRLSGYTAGNGVLYLSSDCPGSTAPTPVVVSGCTSAANRISSSTLAEEVMCQTMTAGQTVYAMVDENALTAGGTFTLEVNACDREVEANGTPATANALSCGKEGTITADDRDFFTLGSPGANWRTFAMIDGVSSTSADTRLRINDTANTLEFDDDDGDAAFGSSGFNSVIGGGRLNDGSMYLSVGGYSNTTQVEPYRLYAVLQPPIAYATAEVEPNDTSATANGPANGYFTSTLSTSSDVDFYSFTAAAGDLVYVGADGDRDRDGTACDTTIALLATDGTTVLASANGSTTSQTPTPSPGIGLTATTPSFAGEGLVYRIRTGGTYYVRVTGTPGSGATGQDYALSVSRNCQTPPADLAISQTADVDPVTGGSDVTYTVTMTNNGPNTAYSPTLTDTAPANMTFVSVTPPSGWTCTTPSGGTYTCTTGELSSGATAASAVFTIVYRANYCTGNVATTHTVAASSGTTDPNGNNNASGIVTNISDPGTCNDFNACTLNDQCQGNTCVGTPKDCSDGSLCTTDSCNTTTGECEYTNVTCNDSNACTDDTCEALTGCVYTNDDTNTCDDGLYCTVQDRCSVGACIADPRDCGDGNVCTTDSCNETTDVCVNTNAPNPCDDGNACTSNDVCGENASLITSENFDGVTAPALPAGWTTTVATGAPTDVFTTVTDFADTAPNAAWAADTASASDKSLVSPALSVPGSVTSINFRHRYDLEGTTTCFDGAVLEISIASGAWTDIVAAGGSFVTGGYNGTISASTNPLNTRAGFCFNTAGSFVTVKAMMPVSALGQSVQLRWRVGTDSSVGRTGYWVDSFSLNDATYACQSGPPTDCNDGLACSTDSCDTVLGCQYAPVTAGTVCRPSAGVCDAADICDGVNYSCTDGKFTNECRAAAGSCDIAENCNGVSNDCPADAVVGAGTECRAATGLCDAAELCDGASGACPADALRPLGFECRASAGVCDDADLCDGVTDACPDVFKPATFECRASTADCDPAELCTGTGAACPADTVGRSGPVGFTVTLTHLAPTTTIQWSEVQPGPFNVYRGSFFNGGTWNDGETCYQQLVPGPSVTDVSTPAGESMYFYLVSRKSGTCDESSLGDRSGGGERPNLSPCP